MGVEGLFKDAPTFRWTRDEDKGTARATGPRGVTARLWRSGLSGKLVLTVEGPGTITRSGRVESYEDARAKAEEWLREEDHA